jgi:hypothetical protein
MTSRLSVDLTAADNDDEVLSAREKKGGEGDSSRT